MRKKVIFALVLVYFAWYGMPLRSRKDHNHEFKYFRIINTPTNYIVVEITPNTERKGE